MGPGFESLRAYTLGEVAEWSIAPVLKTDVLRGTGGSNPSLSAANEEQQKLFLVFLYNSVIWQVAGSPAKLGVKYYSIPHIVA